MVCINRAFALPRLYPLRWQVTSHDPLVIVNETTAATTTTLGQKSAAAIEPTWSSDAQIGRVLLCFTFVKHIENPCSMVPNPIILGIDVKAF